MHMSRQKVRTQEKTTRRGFFKSVAVGGAAVVAAAAGTAVVQRKAGVTELAEDAESTGYRESAHVRHYYRTLKV